jgi:hypothetical protein
VKRCSPHRVRSGSRASAPQVVTREWAQNEAGALFRTLVKEGTAVESRTFRKVGERVEGSFTMANDLWRTARGTLTQSVKQAAETATTLVRETLPTRLPDPGGVPRKGQAAGEDRAHAQGQAAQDDRAQAREARVQAHLTGYTPGNGGPPRRRPTD